MSARRTLAAILVIGGGLQLQAGVATSAQGPSPAHARLTGHFTMTGRITTAIRIHGERKGERVRRTWTFTPKCSSGACARIGLERERSGGQHDRLTLRHREPGHYVGSGSFYAPVRCGGKLYHRGELVRFTIDVRVTHATTSGQMVIADRLSATYVNRRRINETPCVAFPGHDAARYSGRLTPASGGVGP